MLVRRVFFGLAALSLAVLVFIAGYAAYPLLHQGSLPTVTPPGSDVAEGEAEMGKYWQVWELLDRDFFGDKPDAAKRTDGAIAGMVQTFNDPYTFFVEPQTRELERDQLAGKFGGIGANLEQTDAGLRAFAARRPARRPGRRPQGRPAADGRRPRGHAADDDRRGDRTAARPGRLVDHAGRAPPGADAGTAPATGSGTGAGTALAATATVARRPRN